MIEIVVQLLLAPALVQYVKVCLKPLLTESSRRHLF